jgi:hypothetical protein
VVREERLLFRPEEVGTLEVGDLFCVFAVAAEADAVEHWLNGL